MKEILFQHQGKKYSANLDNQVDLSLPITPSESAASAWYVKPPVIEPVKADGFIGSVQHGGSVNFRNVTFNPHGNCTHTECLGHITSEVHSVNEKIKDYHLFSTLVTIQPEMVNGDSVLLRKHFEGKLSSKPEAIIIRTEPNSSDKKTMQYSNQNPPYIDSKAMRFIVESGVKHLLIDLPSVDKEVDAGVLASHHVFWGLDAPSGHLGEDRSITELIYVPNEVLDGDYNLNMQHAPMENDAAPSRPLIYSFSEV
ncbi:MAG: cyclase family protein [Flavobacteriales bacterium]|nr:cyclase family protein [Flavobacteriales bacterium]